MKVKELLCSPEKWTTRASARLANGSECWDVDNEDAVSFCLGAAIYNRYGDEYESIEEKVCNYLITTDSGYEDVITFNDNVNFEDIRHVIVELDI